MYLTNKSPTDIIFPITPNTPQVLQSVRHALKQSDHLSPVTHTETITYYYHVCSVCCMHAVQHIRFVTLSVALWNLSIFDMHSHDMMTSPNGMSTMCFIGKYEPEHPSRYQRFEPETRQPIVHRNITHRYVYGKYIYA